MQTIIVTSVTEHLDSLQSLINSIVVIAAVVAWAGVQRSPVIKVLGTDIDRRHAFFVMSGLYLIANVIVLITLLRLGDLIAMLDDVHLAEGAWSLAVHPWVLNPFAHFGSSQVAKTYSLGGSGLLVVTWWLCNTSLSTLLDDKRNKIGKILLGVFICLGIASLLAIYAVHFRLGFALGAAGTSNPILHELAVEIVRGDGVRIASVILGGVIGSLLFTAAIALQVRVSRST